MKYGGREGGWGRVGGEVGGISITTQSHAACLATRTLQPHAPHPEPHILHPIPDGQNDGCQTRLRGTGQRLITTRQFVSR
jgi:hypothetical protein